MVATDQSIDISSRSQRFLDTWGMFTANRAALFGLVLMVLVVILAFFGPLVYPSDPFEMVGAPMTPPGPDQLLGTDYLGRDILSGIVHGARVTLLVGVTATLFSVIIGIIIGVLAGFYGGWVENLLMRVTEFFQVLGQEWPG
jgi:peptide/nickel transport system permease protein